MEADTVTQKLNAITRLPQICTLFIRRTLAVATAACLLPSAGFAEEEYLLFQSLSLGPQPIQNAFYSPDGQYLLTLGRKHTVEIWEGMSGRRLRVIPTARHEAITMTAHPSEPLLFTGGRDDTIRLWDQVQAVTRGTLRGHTADVTALTLNIPGTVLVSGSDDGSLLVWDVAQQRVSAQVLEAHRAKVSALAVHPAGNVLASADASGEIRWWSFPALAPLGSLSVHAGEVSALRFNALGDRMITADTAGELIVWDWETTEVLHRTNLGAPLQDIAQHIDGKTLATAAGNRVQFWNLQDVTEQSGALTLESNLRTVRFDGSSRRLITGLENGNVLLWQLGESSLIGSLQGHDRPVTSVDFSANGRYLLSASVDKTMRLWDVQEQKQLNTFEAGNHRVQDIQFTPDGKQFATAGADSRIVFWDLETGEEQQELRKHQGKVNVIAFHPQKPWMVSGGSDQQWLMWDLETGQVLRSKKAHRDQIYSVTFSPAGDLLASASGDRTIKLWRVSDGALVAAIQAHERAITDVVFHPTRPLLVSASQDNLIQIWDIEQPQNPVLRNKLEGHSEAVNQIFFGPNGRRMLSVSQDKTVRMWDVESGSLIQILSGEATPLISGSISRDGRLIAVGSLGGDISLLAYPLSGAEFAEEERQENSSEVIRGEMTNVDAGARAQFVAQEGRAQPVVAQEIRMEEDLEESSLEMSIEEREVYLVPPVKKVVDRREELQRNLNQVLSQFQTCRDRDMLREMVTQSLRGTPDDKAAYHALMKVAVIEQDLPLLLLSAMLGKDATWHNQVYSYQELIEVERNFAYWLDQIFDPSFRRQGGAMGINYRTCSGSQQRFEVPEELFSMRPPQEFLREVRKTPRLIDILDFRGLTIEEFQNRLLAEIERVEQGGRPYEAVRPPLPADKTSVDRDTGTVVLNLENFPTWRNSGKIEFQLRRSGQTWQTYYTAQDLIASLQLPVGAYYLKIGENIQHAFLLKTNEQVEVRP
jgi:WD40 repeat protein